MRKGWYGQSGRHSKAAKLGWRRKLRAGGQKIRFVKHLFKKGARKIAEPIEEVAEQAVKAGKEVEVVWVKSARETTPGKIAHRVHKWGSEEFEKFKAEEEGRPYPEPTRTLRDEDYQYTHPHKKRVL